MKLYNVPRNTTHVWLDAIMFPEYNWAKRLAFYKKAEDGSWFVYSDLTDWRKSKNDDTWFSKQIEDNQFVSIDCCEVQNILGE